ncbi:ABC transporter substrate-binding protein [Xanthobacter aminoxidans]|uniref:ABC transporter substrate-binding protein n=1 Tax=Xanthobacter aminoxidans TaxID=186280 RepID=UPI00372713B2
MGWAAAKAATDPVSRLYTVSAFANAGSDLIATVKQAKEFGVSGGKQTFAAFATYISDIHSLGLSDAKGLMFISVFYWDLNPKTRDFAKRFEVLRPGRMPSQGHAATYSSLTSYFTAAKQVGSTKEGANIVKNMRERGAFDDPLFGRTTVRIDGRAMYQTYLVKVKTPEESKGGWDYYNIVHKIPADQAFRTLKESKAAGCTLVP